MSLKDSPEYYHEVLKRIPPRAVPPFEDEAMQARVWGRRWGVYNDVGPLRMVLVHRPGDEIRVMSGDKYDPAIEALIDDEQQWYYRDEKAPDLVKMQAEHDAMVAALEREGTEVVSVDGAPTDPKAMYTRDNAIAVAGIVLSHPTTHTTASRHSPASAWPTRSRLTGLWWPRRSGCEILAVTVPPGAFAS